MGNGNGESWTAWSKHVLLELERLSDNDKDLSDKMDKIKDMISNLRVRIAVITFSVTILMNIGIALAVQFLKR